jgi:hypothetical protein
MIVDHRDMKYLFVTNHYDIHLNGLCYVDNQLCKFQLFSDWEDDDSKYLVTPLSSIEKIKALWSKKKFEICIGYHWTYPNRLNGEVFYTKTPQWFWKIVFKMYYGCNKLRSNK